MTSALTNITIHKLQNGIVLFMLMSRKWIIYISSQSLHNGDLEKIIYSACVAQSSKYFSAQVVRPDQHGKTRNQPLLEAPWKHCVTFPLITMLMHITLTSLLSVEYISHLSRKSREKNLPNFEELVGGLLISTPSVLKECTIRDGGSIQLCP